MNYTNAICSPRSSPVRLQRVALTVLIALAVTIVGATFKTCASMNRLKRRAYVGGLASRCPRQTLNAPKHRFSAIFAAPWRQDIDDRGTLSRTASRARGAEIADACRPPRAPERTREIERVRSRAASVLFVSSFASRSFGYGQPTTSVGGGPAVREVHKSPPVLPPLEPRTSRTLNDAVGGRERRKARRSRQLVAPAPSPPPRRSPRRRESAARPSWSSRYEPVPLHERHVRRDGGFHLLRHAVLYMNVRL